MKYFYHSGGLGDMVYSLPTVQAMGGGVYITGMSKDAHNAIAPLLGKQSCIKGVLHVSDSGLPPDFVNLSNFRNHPLFTRKHIAELTAETFGADISGWQKGWLYPDNFNFGGLDYAVINVTPRYRDRFFNWDGEIRYLLNNVGRVVYLGDIKEYSEFINKRRKKSIRREVEYIHTQNFHDAAEWIASAKFFSGNQSAMLAIRQGLGMAYRFEQSPNHLDTEQGSDNETIINPFTRRVHLATVCAKKALFDIKSKRYHA